MPARSTLLASAVLTVFGIVGLTVVSDARPLRAPTVVLLDQMYHSAPVVVPTQPAWLRTSHD
ncbi:hypothetical protein [Deinococcus maricopensis]|uniref:Sporulation domain protein n=1 Tax=Deinococcus maricopensis (strain DSM 21211 / LMG 22137 / NRRL B-23946 / LB-34) TaxID=709986 RepID=E8U5A1_DEIML|nr:hypothetical protein [Deinococcus maricopensis]ADV66240.1 sporulation domain protein [Deinococcus maricopensis DSM 21211]